MERPYRCPSGTLVCAMAGLLLLFSAGTVSGDETGLMAVGVRGGVSVRGESPLGEQMRQDFVGGDVLAMFRLPWGWYSQSGWGVGSRLMTSVGAMESEGVTGFVASAVPLVVFGSRDGHYSLDVGLGGALISEHRYGKQNLGGPFQFVGTLGISAVLFKPVGVGYRFQHYSDGTIYGSDSRGVDLHMIELTYRY
jgi:lipid A 3-O-deacylase PagL